MSFAFIFCEEDYGISQRSCSRFHLLHHHLSGAVDSQDVAGEVLAGPPRCSAGRTRNWEGDRNIRLYWKLDRFGECWLNIHKEKQKITSVHLPGVSGPPVPLTFICQWLKAQQTTAYSPGSSITSQPTNFFTARLLWANRRPRVSLLLLPKEARNTMMHRSSRWLSAVSERLGRGEGWMG